MGLYKIPCSTYDLSRKDAEDLYRTLCDAMGVERGDSFDFCTAVTAMMPGEAKGFIICGKNIAILAKESTTEVHTEFDTPELRTLMEEYITELPDQRRLRPGTPNASNRQ